MADEKENEENHMRFDRPDFKKIIELHHRWTSYNLDWRKKTSDLKVHAQNAIRIEARKLFADSPAVCFVRIHFADRFEVVVKKGEFLHSLWLNPIQGTLKAPDAVPAMLVAKLLVTGDVEKIVQFARATDAWDGKREDDERPPLRIDINPVETKPVAKKAKIESDDDGEGSDDCDCECEDE